jgi:hypothetical protein
MIDSFMKVNSKLSNLEYSTAGSLRRESAIFCLKSRVQNAHVTYNTCNIYTRQVFFCDMLRQ